MTNVKAPELIAHFDVYGSRPDQWTVCDGPEMGPGTDIYLLGPRDLRGFINIDDDEGDVKVEITHDSERKPPQVYSLSIDEISNFMHTESNFKI